MEIIAWNDAKKGFLCTAAFFFTVVASMFLAWRYPGNSGVVILSLGALPAILCFSLSGYYLHGKSISFLEDLLIIDYGSFFVYRRRIRHGSMVPGRIEPVDISDVMDSLPWKTGKSVIEYRNMESAGTGRDEDGAFVYITYHGKWDVSLKKRFYETEIGAENMRKLARILSDIAHTYGFEFSDSAGVLIPTGDNSGKEAYEIR